MEDIEQQDVDLNNESEAPELTEQDDADGAAPETAKPTQGKKSFTTEQKLARGVRMVQKWAKELGIENPLIKTDGGKPEAKVQTSELDETALDYLDLKGITEDEDIAVIQKVMKQTGQTVRQVLKDDYVTQKLEANKSKREVAAAVPSATRRSTPGQSNDLEAAIAKYEASGFKELPSDYKLRTAVVNAMVERQSGNKPNWR